MQGADNRALLDDCLGEAIFSGTEAGEGVDRSGGHFGEAEIEQLDARFRDQNIGRLEIAMNDADRRRAASRAWAISMA